MANMKLLAIGGVLETGMGLGLLVAPSMLANLLLRSPLSGAGVVVGRVGGGAVLALGIACWCARSTPLSPAGLGVAWGFLAYNLVACVTLAGAGLAPASGGPLSLGAAVLHGVLGAALLKALLGRGRPPARP